MCVGDPGVRADAVAVATISTANLRGFLEIKTQRVMGRVFLSLEPFSLMGRICSVLLSVRSDRSVGVYVLKQRTPLRDSIVFFHMSVQLILLLGYNMKQAERSKFTERGYSHNTDELILLISHSSPSNVLLKSALGGVSPVWHQY